MSCKFKLAVKRQITLLQATICLLLQLPYLVICVMPANTHEDVCVSLSAVRWDHPAHLITGCFPVAGSGADVVVLASVLYSGTS